MDTSLTESNQPPVSVETAQLSSSERDITPSDEPTENQPLQVITIGVNSPYYLH